MRKLFCLASFRGKSKTSRSKVMREDTCHQETGAQLHSSVDMLELDDLRNSTSILQQNMKMEFVNLCTCENERKEPASIYASENEGFSGDLVFAELAGNEHETELVVSDLDQHRSVSDDSSRSLTNEAAAYFMDNQGYTYQVRSVESATDNECIRIPSTPDLSESPVLSSADQGIDTVLFGDRVANGLTCRDHGVFETDLASVCQVPSVESATDNEFIRISSTPDLSESPVLSLADQGIDTVLFGDRVANGFSCRDHGVFETDLASLCNSSFLCNKCNEFSPEVEFNSPLAVACRVDKEACRIDIFRDHGVFETDFPSVCNSSFLCNQCNEISPEVEFNSPLAAASRVGKEACRIDDRDLKQQFQSRTSEHPPHVGKVTDIDSGQEISQSSYNISDSNLMFTETNSEVLKSEESSKNQPLAKHKSWWKAFMFRHTNSQKKGSCLTNGEMDEKHINPIVGYAPDICDSNVGKVSDSAVSAVDLRPTSVPRDQVKPSSSEGRSNALDGQEHGLAECQHVLSRHGARKEHYSSGPIGMLEKDIFAEPAIFWPAKEYTAISKNAGFKRVEDWINSIDPGIVPPEEAVEDDPRTVGPSDILKAGLYRNPVGAEIPNLNRKNGRAVGTNFEITNAAAISLNAFSTAAVFSGTGLKAMPLLGMFSSLKTLNLSGNCIERIIPGSLPRNLHTLDLSRNRIAVVEGLRDLTRLRVINLSDNRIPRIGHGLANCTLTKELYLSGNNISDVEGLHRLSKLSVLDLGFNKLTTSKSLGQLAANYSSLLALNLLGNPVHANLGEEQLRRLIITLAPRLTFLNKQPVKTVSAKVVVMDSVARAAMGSSHHASNSQRRRKQAGTSVQKTRLPGHGARKEARAYGNYRAKHQPFSNQPLEKGIDNEIHPLGSASPCSVDEWPAQLMDLASQEGMSHSRSKETLCDQT